MSARVDGEGGCLWVTGGEDWAVCMSWVVSSGLGPGEWKVDVGSGTAVVGAAGDRGGRIVGRERA